MLSTRFYTTVFFLGAFIAGIGQNAFMELYPTTYDRTARDIVRTSDGGYLLCGMTNNSDITDCDAYVIKTDNNGIMQWAKTYGGTKPDYPYSIVETTDGNYFIAGYSQSYGGGDLDMYLLKIDGSGNVQSGFPKTYGGFQFDELREIIKTSDGNYVMVGTSKSYDSGNQQAVLIKINNSGTVIWTERYGGTGLEFGNAVRECADGGFIITGETYSFGQNGEMYLVKTNSSGAKVWENHYGGSLDDEGVGVEIGNDGSYIVAVRDSTAAKDIDVRVMKIDPNTQAKIWDRTFGAGLKDTPKTIRKLNDGNFIIGAISRSFGWINPDMWLLKVEPQNGDTLWSRHFGSSDHEHCHMAKQDPNENAILAVGHARSNINGSGWGQKIMFVKMNMDGQMGALSLDELVKGDFSLYPNPTEGSISINLENTNNVMLRVSNILGESVHEEMLSADGKTIDLTGNVPGVYLVTLSSGSLQVSRKIILK